MLNRIAVAIGAGLAAALLFCATARGTEAALALAFVTPLPIMISALGWGLEANAISAIVACIVVAGVIDPGLALLFGLTTGLPAALLSGIAAMTSLNPFDRALPPAKPYRADLGTLAMFAAGLGVVVSAGPLALMVVTNGGYAKAMAAFRAMLESQVQEAMGNGMGLPQDFGSDEVVRIIVQFAPAAFAASTTLVLLLNLYAAARIVQLSQRLNRPWADIPTNLKLPAPLALVAAAAGAAWMFSPEPYNPFAATVAAPLGLIFLFQGLAALHALSRRAPGRLALIAALYIALFIAPRWIGPALALFGLAESVLSLRTRQAAHPFKT